MGGGINVRVYTQSCLTLLQPHRLNHTRLLWPWEFSGKNTGVGSHFFLQRISLIQGSNPICCVSCISGRFFTLWAIKEASIAAKKMNQQKGNFSDIQYFNFSLFSFFLSFFFLLFPEQRIKDKKRLDISFQIELSKIWELGSRVFQALFLLILCKKQLRPVGVFYMEVWNCVYTHLYTAKHLETTMTFPKESILNTGSDSFVKASQLSSGFSF